MKNYLLEVQRRTTAGASKKPEKLQQKKVYRKIRRWTLKLFDKSITEVQK
jgi:hypothetical protein